MANNRRHGQSGSPGRGVSYLFQGFRLMLTPGIRGIVIMPILINVLLFAGGMVLALQQFGHLLAWIEQKLPSWLDWLSFLLWPFLILSTFLILAYLFTLLANFIASPFNGLLSERVERHLTGRKPDANAPERSFLTELACAIPSSLAREVRKMAYFLPRALACLALFLIPVIGQFVAPVLWFLFTAWMMAVEYGDYPFDNHRISFPAMHRRMKKSRGLCVGFGSTIAMTTMIPLLNLIVMPAAVCGATALWVNHFRDSPHPSPASRAQTQSDPPNPGASVQPPTPPA